MPDYPLASTDLSEQDQESLRWMYQPLVGAAVETRRDMDSIAFRYVATLTTLTAAIASDGVDIVGWSAKAAVVVLVLAIVGVALSALQKRDRVYRSINQGLVKIEAGLGGFQDGRFIHNDRLFDWGNVGKASILDVQVLPHLLGVSTIGVLCIFATLADSI